MAEFRAQPEVVDFSQWSWDAGRYSGNVRPWRIPDDAVRSGLNFETRYGLLEKRKGYTITTPASGPASESGQVNGLVRCYGSSEGAKLLVYLTDGKLYYLSGASLTSIMGGHGDITGNATFAVWKRKLWLTTQTDGLMYWTMLNAGALTNAAAGPASKCAYVHLYKQANRLVAGGSVDASKDSIVYHSDLGLPETWPTNNFFHIPEDMTGDRVRGFADMPGGELVIFGDRTVNLLYGRVKPDFILRTVDWVNGCTAPYSIVSTLKGVFYKSRDGFYMYTGGMGSQRVSEAIQDLVDAMGDGDMVAELVQENRIFISYKDTSSSSVNDRVLVYNLPTRANPLGTWDGPWTYGVNAFSWWNGAGDAGEIYGTTAATATQNQLWRLEQNYADGANPYRMEVTTKQFVVSMNPALEAKSLTVAADVTEVGMLDVDVSVNGTAWEDIDRDISLSSTGRYEGDEDAKPAKRSEVYYNVRGSALEKRRLRSVQFRMRTMRDKKAAAIRGFRFTGAPSVEVG